MNGPLILCDVDETIIDQQSRLTVGDDTFRAAIARAQARGARIGLNSDSALETLDRRARDYGFRGPIVAELGAMVTSDDGLVFTNPETRWLRELRDRFVRAFTERSRAKTFAVLVGDVNQLADALPALPSVAEPRTLILVNGFRRCSLAYYVRRWEHSGITRDPRATAEIMTILDDEVGPSLGERWFDRDVDANPDYGICIIHDRKTQKACAVRHLIAQAGGQPVYMIGNSTSDDLKDPRVIQCAVGNAKPEYKERCIATGGHIAERDLTAGVIELLDRIAV